MGAVLILMTLGAVLLFAEVVVPGGVLGAAAFAAFLGGVYAAWKSMGAGAATLAALAAIALSFAAVFAWAYVLPRTAMGKKILPKPDEPESAASPLEFLAGKDAVAQTQMLPSGKVCVDGNIYDASCIDGPAQVGQKLKVVSADLSGLKVRSSK